MTNNKFIWTEKDILIKKRDKKSFAVKTEAYYLRVLSRAVRDLYNNRITSDDMLSEMLRLLDEQIVRAWNEGMRANALDPARDMTAEWEAEIRRIQDSEAGYTQGFVDAIVAAREAGKPIQPLLDRAGLWASRYADVMSRAQVLTAPKDLLMVWRYGDTVEHCATCSEMAGMGAKPASFWAEKQAEGIYPKSPELACHGFRCDCRLESVDEAEKSLKFDPDQPRDEAGRWTSDGGGGETLNLTGMGEVTKIEALSEYHGKIRGLCSDLGFPENRVVFVPEIGARMGTYNTDTKEITLYALAFRDNDVLGGVLSHEIAHAIFYEKNDSEWVGYFQSYANEYINIAKDDMDYDERTRYEDNFRIVIREMGGVSDYSNKFWGQEAESSASMFKIAVSETFSEIARLDAEGKGNTVPGFWRDAYEEIMKK